jgi:NADH-quinone oxidoreductase subunit J
MAIAFYSMATIMIVAAALVVLMKNPVHSVLFLILTFFSAAGLMVLLGAEFLALLLIVVYVGAVAVLFLFVVMMLDVDFASLRKGFANYLPIGALVGVVVSVELFMALYALASHGAVGANMDPVQQGPDNIKAIGRVLYTDYAYLFQGAGLVLLVAMIGAIVLTLRHRVHVKRQDIFKQVSRRRKDSVIIAKAKTGEGIEE